jgi:C-terminal processing protease CtpA/Prc
MIGVKSYTCASCGSDRKADGRPEYFFATEPVVIEGLPGSVFKPGDVIVSIDGKPITTREGAEAFAHPRLGAVRVGFRRVIPPQGATDMDVTLTLSKICGATLKPDPNDRDTVRYMGAVNRVPLDLTSLLGFAVSCTPSCKRAKASDGTVYWKHDGYPAIVAMRKTGPAADADLRPGDVIVEVDGKSVLEEAGGLRLQRPNAKSLRLVIIRDGARIEKTLHLKD